MRHISVRTVTAAAALAATASIHAGGWTDAVPDLQPGARG